MHHQPFWCEENIWHLAADPAVGDGQRWVMFVSGSPSHVACWNQRAAPAPDAPVLWDYHVVLVVRSPAAAIWDLDTRAGFPLPAATWLAQTFPCPDDVRPAFQPRFALIPSDRFRAAFTTDRRHMRTTSGGWQKPLPPWPAPQGDGTLNLDDCIAEARAGYTRAGLEAWLTS